MKRKRTRDRKVNTMSDESEEREESEERKRRGEDGRKKGIKTMRGKMEIENDITKCNVPV